MGTRPAGDQQPDDLRQYLDVGMCVIVVDGKLKDLEKRILAKTLVEQCAENYRGKKHYLLTKPSQWIDVLCLLQRDNATRSLTNEDITNILNAFKKGYVKHKKEYDMLFSREERNLVGSYVQGNFNANPNLGSIEQNLLDTLLLGQKSEQIRKLLSKSVSIAIVEDLKLTMKDLNEAVYHIKIRYTTLDTTLLRVNAEYLNKTRNKVVHQAFCFESEDDRKTFLEKFRLIIDCLNFGHYFDLEDIGAIDQKVRA